MVALAATNVVGVILFGTLYAAAGARYLSQGSFLACLAVVFALITWLWQRTEARHRALEPVRRIGRAALGYVAVLIAVPMITLMPLFWLDTQLPPAAGLSSLLAPTMSIVLISLVLVMLVNLAGAVVALARGLRGRTGA